MPASKPAPNPVCDSPSPQSGINWLEIAFFSLVIFGGFFFLRNAPHWGQMAYVGSAQYGDAEFWWNGALHFAQGIVEENPNITYRMGYATFGGLIAAVLGPEYRVFHQILLIVFLVTSCGMYASLRGLISRIAAAATVLFLVFNPFTAEWLAISTSDALGLILNLLAILCLIAGVSDRLRLRWIFGFGILFSCASLTRPLMTPFLAPAALVVIVAAWGEWRKLATALGLMLSAFVLPTVAWMTFMAATTGNFALTGESQDSSAFYAASDPKIQVWRGDMYIPVRESAKKHFQTEQPTPKQLNAEFWNMTRSNYQMHWRYHLERLWRNAFELASFTPKRSAVSSSFTERWRGIFKWSLTLGLTIMMLRQRRFLAAFAVGSIGAIWAIWPQTQPWFVLGASWLGLSALLSGQRGLFLWTVYWWVGVMALYLTGGTWGPPVGAVQDLNALGYRLGFQFFFSADLLIIGLLGSITLGAVQSESTHRLLGRSSSATRLSLLGLRGLLVLLAVLLGTGAVIVTWRLVEQAIKRPTTYPSLDALHSLDVIQGATRLTDITPLRVAINAQTGVPLLTKAMSSGFVWNLTGQKRSMLLLYQQDHVQPISMSPRNIYVEISRQVPEREWMNRQGAWVLRSFPNTAQVSNQIYYIENPAVQAFIPLAPDGKSYNTEKIVVFPLAKSATQLTAAGALTISGAEPEWSQNSGDLKFPRRFALRASETDQTIRLKLNLASTRGQRSFRVGVRLESAAGIAQRHTPVYLHVVEIGSPTSTMWGNDLQPDSPVPLQVNQIPTDGASAFTLTVYHLEPGDTLWLYELVLTADNFTH
ncbi:MAG: hypothetical protein CMI16_01955 [Opitutaceae bacterium]|nr:hypothetical protein [Opitutaceae bacterium]